MGVEMGVGGLQLSRDTIAGSRQARFALGVFAGYSPFRWLRVGFNASGWLIEPSGDYADPSKGVRVSNAFGQLELFPFKKIALFTNLQWGRSQYTNMHVDGYQAIGTGTKVGLGYEYRIGNHGWLSLVMNYGFGSFKDVNNFVISVNNQHFDAFEVMVGLTYN